MNVLNLLCVQWVGVGDKMAASTVGPYLRPRHSKAANTTGQVIARLSRNLIKFLGSVPIMARYVNYWHTM